MSHSAQRPARPWSTAGRWSPPAPRQPRPLRVARAPRFLHGGRRLGARGVLEWRCWPRVSPGGQRPSGPSGCPFALSTKHVRLWSPRQRRHRCSRLQLAAGGLSFCSLVRAPRSSAPCDKSPHHLAAWGTLSVAGNSKATQQVPLARGLCAGSIGAGPVSAGAGGSACPGPPVLLDSLPGLAAGLPERGCRGLQREHPSQSPSTHTCPWRCSAATPPPRHPVTQARSGWCRRRAGLPGQRPRSQRPRELVAFSWACSPRCQPCP